MKFIHRLFRLGRRWFACGTSAAARGPFGWAHAIRVEYYAEAQLKGNRLDGGSQAVVAWCNGLVEGDGAP